MTPCLRRRLEGLEAGVWLTSKGQHIPLRRMADGHVLNALLRLLADDGDQHLIDALANEVNQRGLRLEAFAIARNRGWR